MTRSGVQHALRHRLLVLPQPGTQRPRPVRRDQPAGTPRTQAGASLGGKLVQDKLFYFFNSEVHRRDFPLVASLARPPLFDSYGNVRRHLRGHRRAVRSRAPFPEPSIPGSGPDGRFGAGLRQTGLAALADATTSAPVSTTCAGSRPNGFQTQAVLNNGAGVGANGNSSVRTRYGRLEWMYIPDGTRINEFRFGWFKDRHADNLNPNLIPRHRPGADHRGRPGQPGCQRGSAAHRSQREPLPGCRQPYAGLRTAYLEVRLRLFEHGRFRPLPAQSERNLRVRGFHVVRLDFSGNTTGARRWQTYSQRFGNPVFDETVRDYGLFAEDQFRVNSRVTLHYGLRYEYSALPQPKQANPDYPESGHIPSVKTNLAPRFGMAVAFNRSRSVVRGGYGIFYARYHTGLITTFFQENGIGQPSIQLETRFLASPQSGPCFPTCCRLPTASSAVDLTIPFQGLPEPLHSSGGSRDRTRHLRGLESERLVADEPGAAPHHGARPEHRAAGVDGDLRDRRRARQGGGQLHHPGLPPGQPRQSQVAAREQRGIRRQQLLQRPGGAVAQAPFARGGGFSGLHLVARDRLQSGRRRG